MQAESQVPSAKGVWLGAGGLTTRSTGLAPSSSAEDENFSSPVSPGVRSLSTSADAFDYDERSLASYILRRFFVSVASKLGFDRKLRSSAAKSY